MKVNLYAGYSTLSVALNAGIDPTIRYYPTNSQILELMFIMFPKMNLEFGHKYKLKKSILESGVKIAYSTHDGETPHSEQLRKEKAPETNAIVLQPGTITDSFGLNRLCLFPIIECIIPDIQEAYEASDKIIKYWVNNEFNPGMTGEESYLGEDLSIKEADLKAQITPLDNYFLIAAREMVAEGSSIKAFERNESGTPKVVDVPGYTNFEIYMGYEPYDTIYLPIFNQHVADRAFEYYRNGIPYEYEWLKSVQPLDFLSLWALELDKTYLLRTYCQCSNNVLFGDILEFTIKYDKDYDSRSVEIISKTGEEQIVEDHCFPEWVHSFAAVIGGGADELKAKGFPTRDMLNLRRSLKL